MQQPESGDFTEDEDASELSRSQARIERLKELRARAEKSQQERAERIMAKQAERERRQFMQAKIAELESKQEAGTTLSQEEQQFLQEARKEFPNIEPIGSEDLDEEVEVSLNDLWEEESQNEMPELEFEDEAGEGKDAKNVIPEAKEIIDEQT